MDEQQPTNAEIMQMLREQRAGAVEQQRRMARIEADNLELKAENGELKAELARQRLEKVSLTSRMNEVEGGPAPHDKKLTRAGLFRAAAMGSAAVIGAGALGTLGTEDAAAATTDTNFLANGTLTNFDARGTSNYGVNTAVGNFTIGGAFLGSTYGASGNGNGPTGIGLYGQGAQYGAELYSPNGVPLYLFPGLTAGSPTTGAHTIGEVYVDSTGRIYHCVTAGTPGTWVPLNALVPITPVRVLDTRSATQVGTSTGPFATGSTLTFAIAGQTFSTSSGTFTFPSNTIGVVGNVVAVTPTGAGYLIACPQGATLPIAASVNFVPPGTGSDIYYSIGNNVTVALSASGQMSIHMGLVGSATVQVVLDIAGYLV